MDNVYLTEINGFEGPRIEADTFEQAEAIGYTIHKDLKVLGKIIMEVEQFELN